MLDYTGIKCPVCEKPFQAGDDIVVCPQCGAPYHRECYQKEGKCKFEELHEQGKNWEPPAPPQKPDVSAEIKDQECPNCGKLNAHSALFCDQCGASLSGNPTAHQNQNANPASAKKQNPYASNPTPFPGASPFPGGGMGGAPMPFALDPLGGVGPDELIDDIPASEMAKLVQTNTAYYLPVFRNLKKYKRNRFNFCAFLFSGGWMIYRKQYKLGALVTGLVFALFIAYTYVSMVYTLPLLSNLLTQAGVDPQATTYTTQQTTAFFELLAQNPEHILPLLLPMLFLGLILIIMIIIGICGNRLYMNHCIKTIHELREENPPAAEYNVQLQTRGNVNVPAAICLLICYMIMTWLPRFL